MEMEATLHLERDNILLKNLGNMDGPIPLLHHAKRHAETKLLKNQRNVRDGIVRYYAVDTEKCKCTVPDNYVHAAKSPDAAIMENLWAKMVTESKKHPPPQSEEDLITLLHDLWTEISMEYIKTLINSIPNRLEKIVEVKGSMTKY